MKNSTEMCIWDTGVVQTRVCVCVCMWCVCGACACGVCVVRVRVVCVCGACGVCVVHVRVVCVCVQTRADAPVLSASDSISALFRRDLFSNNFYFTNSL